MALTLDSHPALDLQSTQGFKDDELIVPECCALHSSGG